MEQQNRRKAEIYLDFQPYIDSPPSSPEQLYSQAASADGPTINHWAEIWIKNAKENHAKFGPFKDRSIGQIFEKFKYQSCIIAGAGPSLKHNGHHLKDKGDIPLISCLHNFHFFEDLGVKVDFYVTLDAGEVTVEEVYEGGTKTPDEYWELTRNRTLLAHVSTSPRLLEKWQGKILFYAAPIPQKDVIEKFDEIEVFNAFVGNGGNVLGACLYIAKGWLGCPSITFVGADFCFSYDQKFHAWDSKYDKTLGHVIRAVDVFGNTVLTWQSYNNFKCWFDRIALIEPGHYVNCSEGGTLGAYRDGNISAIRQMELKIWLDMMNRSRHLKTQASSPETAEKLLLF